jgi:hypothetical protein
MQSLLLCEPDISKRKGEAKYASEHRTILGKSDYGIMGPGAKYQIDATIGDIYLVSRFNRAGTIGRPVIYFVIDTFSRMIAGMYVCRPGRPLVGGSYDGDCQRCFRQAPNLLPRQHLLRSPEIRPGKTRKGGMETP